MPEPKKSRRALVDNPEVRAIHNVVRELMPLSRKARARVLRFAMEHLSERELLEDPEPNGGATEE